MVEQTCRSELGRKFRWMKGCQCSQSLYGLVAPHHGEQGVALSTLRPNNQTIGGFFVSNSLVANVQKIRTGAPKYKLMLLMAETNAGVVSV